MITSEFLKELEWKGVKNLEPAQVNELLRLARIGLQVEKFKESGLGEYAAHRVAYIPDDFQPSFIIEEGKSLKEAAANCAAGKHEIFYPEHKTCVCGKIYDEHPH